MHLSIRTPHLHLSIRTPLRAQDTGNKSYILAFGPRFEPKTRQQIVHLSIRTPLRAQDTGSKSYILAFGPRFEPKTAAKNRTSCLVVCVVFFSFGSFHAFISLHYKRHSDPASSPRHRQQTVHLSIRTPLRTQDTGKTSYILAFGSLSPRHRQQIVHLSIHTSFEPTTPATTCAS